MDMYKSVFRIIYPAIEAWFLICAFILTIFTVLFFSMWLIGFGDKDPVLGLYQFISDFFVTGNLVGVASWRIHILFIFLYTLTKWLDKLSGDE
jgi:hypothetical protein